MIQMSGTTQNVERVMLGHGGGGELMGRLIRDHFLPRLGNQRLDALTDGAVLPWAKGSDLVFTTDSFVVSPLVFPGGDIGRLAVAGTVNDLAVMGAEPVALSLGLIIEEGLSIVMLDQILSTIAATASEAGVSVVTGDTKVIERRSMREHGSEDADGLFINTAGVGRVNRGLRLGPQFVEPGDALLINGPVAEHGLAIMSVRSGIEFESAIQSDAAPLNGLIRRLLDSGVRVKFMRDATRSGLAGVLADIIEVGSVSVEIEESRVPVSAASRSAAEMMGLDPLTIANEGKVVFVVDRDDIEPALTSMRGHPLGRRSTRIGWVTDARPPLVELITRVGGRRIIQRPYGEELPRIC